jgi:hypothetical protein
VRRPVSALVLCLSDSLGGLELHVRDHARWLARRSDARLSLALRRGGPLHEQLAGLGAPTFLADSAPGALPLLPARRLAGFARAQGVRTTAATRRWPRSPQGSPARASC